MNICNRPSTQAAFWGRRYLEQGTSGTPDEGLGGPSLPDRAAKGASLGRGLSLVAAMSCGAVVVALCGSAHAAVPSLAATPRNASVTSLVDQSAPRVVEPTTDPISSVSDATGGVTKTVIDIAEPATDATRPNPERIIKKVVTTVRGVVEKVLPPRETVSDPTVTQPHGQTRTKARHILQRVSRRAPLSGRSARTRRSPVSQPLGFTAAESTSERSEQATDRSSAGLVHELGRAAREIAFPALLALFVVAFLVAQDRIDKRDPKLVTWTPEPDGELVVFE